MGTEPLPPGVYPIAVDKYIISYHIISYLNQLRQTGEQWKEKHGTKPYLASFPSVSMLSLPSLRLYLDFQ
jgi:hypothetical protein